MRPHRAPPAPLDLLHPDWAPLHPSPCVPAASLLRPQPHCVPLCLAASHCIPWLAPLPGSAVPPCCVPLHSSSTLLAQLLQEGSWGPRTPWHSLCTRAALHCTSLHPLSIPCLQEVSWGCCAPRHPCCAALHPRCTQMALHCISTASPLCPTVLHCIPTASPLHPDGTAPHPHGIPAAPPLHCTASPLHSLLCPWALLHPCCTLLHPRCIPAASQLSSTTPHCLPKHPPNPQ